MTVSSSFRNFPFEDITLAHIFSMDAEKYPTTHNDTKCHASFKGIDFPRDN